MTDTTNDFERWPMLGDEWIDRQWAESCAQDRFPALTHYTAAVERAVGKVWDAKLGRLRADYAAAHRSLTLELQQHKRCHAEVMRLAERLRKYEPGSPMILG